MEKLTDRILEAIAGNPPLSFFWAVELENGRAVAQFDPETGLENQLSILRKMGSGVRKVMWLPFSNAEFAKLVWMRNRQPVMMLPSETAVITKVPAGAEVVLARRGRLSFGARKSHQRFYLIGFYKDGAVELAGLTQAGRRLTPEELERVIDRGLPTVARGAKEEG